MNKVFVVRGMKRSGNHAVIQWLQAQSGACFFNDAVSISPILRGQQAPPSPRTVGEVIAAQKWSRRLRYHVHALRRGSVNLIFSLEDHPTDFQLFSGPPPSCREIFILRSPGNLFASRIRKAKAMRPPTYSLETDEQRLRAIRLWCDYATAFLRAESPACDAVGIYFDYWLQSRAYRKELARRLDLPFSDEGRDRWSRVGGGSSFDSSPPEESQRIGALTRREEFLDSAEKTALKQVLQAPELESLHSEILLALEPFQEVQDE